MKKILVLGATGDQGHPLLRCLKANNFDAVAALRNPDALKGTEFHDIQTVHAELADRKSMIAAARDMDAIAAHLPFTFDRSEAKLFGDNLVAAAKENNLKKIVFHTSCYVHDTNIGITAHDGRRDIEQAIIDSDIPYAIFESKVFMDNITRIWCKPGIVNNDTFGYPAGPELKICWISLDDIAAFMVEAIKQKNAPNGRFPIGGPEPLTGFEVAEKLSEVTGRKITFNSLTPDEFASAMSLLVTGSTDYVPGSIYDRMAEFYRWYNSQPESPLVVDLEEVLSIFPIKPTPFLEWAKRHDWNDPNDPALAIRYAGAAL